MTNKAEAMRHAIDELGAAELALRKAHYLLEASDNRDLATIVNRAIGETQEASHATATRRNEQ